MAFLFFLQLLEAIIIYNPMMFYLTLGIPRLDPTPYGGLPHLKRLTYEMIYGEIMPNLGERFKIKKIRAQNYDIERW